MTAHVLRSMWDVDVVLALLDGGGTVKVELSEEDGPHGPEPRVELLRVLLDRVQRSHEINDLEWCPHPWVPRHYLHSCVIAPARHRTGDGDGCEPATPSPMSPPRSTIADRET